jgi:hypothetical protein
MWLIDDFRDFEYCKRLFGENTVTIGEIRGFALKRCDDKCSSYYGLFDGDTLVAYNWLMVFKQSMVRGHEFHVKDELMGKGIGREIYLYHILQEKKILVSDRTHTKFTGKLWAKLETIPEVEVMMYNASTTEILPLDRNEVYNNSHMHFLARAR